MNGLEMAMRAAQLADEAAAPDLAGLDPSELDYVRTQALVSLALSAAVLAGQAASPHGINVRRSGQ